MRQIDTSPGGGGGGGTLLYKIDRYVLPQRVKFFNRLLLLLDLNHLQWAVLVWTRIKTLTIMVWNQVWFSREPQEGMMMAGFSCPKIREGCRTAGGCEGRCVMRRLCCITGKWRLKIGMLGFETAPGPASVVFSLSRHCSSGFQTHGLLSGLLTAKWAGHWPRLAKSLAECLPGKAVSCFLVLVPLLWSTAAPLPGPWVHRKEQLLFVWAFVCLTRGYKRMENGMFWSERGQDLKNRAAHPHREFRGVPTPFTELPLSNISFDTHARINEIKMNI